MHLFSVVFGEGDFVFLDDDFEVIWRLELLIEEFNRLA